VFIFWLFGGIFGVYDGCVLFIVCDTSFFFGYFREHDRRMYGRGIDDALGASEGMAAASQIRT
jgi:hypothetical protein